MILAMADYNELRKQYLNHFKEPAPHAMPREEDDMAQLIRQALKNDERLVHPERSAKT